MFTVLFLQHQRCAAMSPPNPPVPFSSWTDEMITLSLEDYNQGKPPPQYLLSDLNPYSYLPSNLPGKYYQGKVVLYICMILLLALNSFYIDNCNEYISSF